MDQQIAFCTAEDGVRIAYATYGGDGPPLLVLPDIVGQVALWKHPDGRGLLEELARGRRLITYDARFTGASERSGEHSSLSCWVRDIRAVIQHLRLDSISLFSVGGISSTLALLYAAQYGVTSMALWGAMHRKPRAPGDMIETFSRAWSWNARSVATIYFPSGPVETLKWFSRTIARAQFHETFGQIMAMEWDFSSLLPTIKAPTLILQREGIKSGDRRWAHEAARLLPRGELLLLDGDADHPIHDREQFIQPLLAFFDQHAPAFVSRGTGEPTAALTEREKEVLSLLAGGRAGREIAAALGISLSTAQRHIANIYAKVGARGRVDAAAYALSRGLVTPRD